MLYHEELKKIINFFLAFSIKKDIIYYKIN